MSDRFANMPDGPFAQLNTLLEGVQPGQDPIMMSIGEPQHAFPEFVSDVLRAHEKDYGKYPPIIGTTPFRDAAAGWLARRYNLPPEVLEPDARILPVNGTREALFNLALVACPTEKAGRRPAVLMPNPFYQCYASAAIAAGAEPHYIAATAENGFLPDFEALDSDLLARTAMIYFCSPANPQGTVAPLDYLKRLITLAREHDITLVIDECYADIYDKEEPPGGLQAALELAVPTSGAASGDVFDNIIVFHSLSKRSNLPGLRTGFCAGDKALINRFRAFRNIAAPQTPLPVLAAATACWNDDAHSAENRARYQVKNDIAERIIGNRYGFYRPAGGFFLWLDVGDGVAVAKQLWADAGLKVLPGSYLARDDAALADKNPGARFIRLALVQDEKTVEEALTRLTNVLS
jgi:aspartate/methionine/tyrosine aminotransferase|tara:strand:+ start:1020 stop:2237 length:1218 start_codon:yes stop_codon:yes gene_type:complete